MARVVLVFGLVLLPCVPVEAQKQAQSSSTLVISLPSVPNPLANDQYAGRLFRGKWRWVDEKGQPASVDPVRALTEAALNCGQQRLKWRGLDYDHGNEMLIANNEAGQRTLTCIAGKVSFDFYARVEGSKVR
ncbi:hypothetical protein [uncultured Sphingomonas sp.]|uniref:hypothetical protein n=1 Tax=uncultured Sphingomonas sp. TaxID=158754 RepID=UPI00262114BF|nr:hypothetical protein [uncultured Sphingomonas sp.]